MRGARAAALAATLWLAAADRAVAQPGATASAVWRPWHPVISLGVGWSGTDQLGSLTAGTRATAVGTATPPGFRLFETSTTLDAAPRADFAIALPVTGRLLVEFSGALSRPRLTTAISGDAEGAPATEASEPVEEFTAGVRLVYDLPRWTLRGRALPYLSAGGAYLRQLHDQRVLVETGQAWQAGVGLRLMLRGGPGRPGRPVGLSAEGGWVWRSGGITVKDGVRGLPTLSLRVFAGL